MRDTKSNYRATNSPVPQGAARISSIADVPNSLREFGVDPEGVFANAGIALSILESADNAVAHESFGRLLAVSATASGCSHFGLSLGARNGLTQLGLIGSLAANAPDVGSALHDIVDKLSIMNRAAILSLVEYKDTATFSYVMLRPNIIGADHIREGCVAMMTQVVRALCGPSWAPDRILFPHRIRGPLYAYLQFFQAEVHFDSESASVIFPSHVLRRPIIGANRSIRREIYENISQIEDFSYDAFADRVRRQVHMAMAQGKFSAVAVARTLNIDSSTLRRKLANEDASFKEIAREAKFEFAKHLMRDTKLDLSAVAAAVGFEEASAFTRAFRCWSDMTPSQWRRGHPTS